VLIATDSVLLSLPAPSAKVLSREARTKALSAKDLSREAKDEAPLSANIEVISASLKGRSLRSRVKLASKGRAKIGEAILVSPITKKKTFKTKPKASQPKGANFQSPQASVMNRLGLVNTDLRDYLSNKRKLRSEEPVHISSSQCGQAGCQLVTVHSVHCCLGTIPTASPSQQLILNRLSARTSEKLESWKKPTKVVHLTAASVKMISRKRSILVPTEEMRDLYSSSQLLGL